MRASNSPGGAPQRTGSASPGAKAAIVIIPKYAPKMTLFVQFLTCLHRCGKRGSRRAYQLVLRVVQLHFMVTQLKLIGTFAPMRPDKRYKVEGLCFF
jgi:hypothetical protein